MGTRRPTCAPKSAAPATPDWLPIRVLRKRRKQKQLHKQKQLQLPHEQQKQKQLQQLQLHTTEAATVPETEATAGNNSYS